MLKKALKGKSHVRNVPFNESFQMIPSQIWKNYVELVKSAKLHIWT